MSRTSLFVFVEGWSDRNVYDRICRQECEPAGLRFDVRTANELPGSPSGKQALLSFFQFLRRRGTLFSDLQGKQTAALFFADKDVDDLLRIQKRSEHFVYTEFYDFDNYTFMYGDLVIGGAGAAGLDEGSVRNGLAPSSWRRTAISTWIEWVSLCLITRISGVSCAVTYGRISQVNNSPCAATDAALLAQHASALQNALKKSKADFDNHYARMFRYVNRLLRLDKADKVFKGKWYKYFLADDLRRIAGARSINSNGLEDRLVEMLRMTLDMRQPWTERYRKAIQLLVESGLT